jgi:hypothetical protein
MSFLKLLPAFGLKPHTALKTPQTLVRGTELESGLLNKYLIKMNKNVFSLGAANLLAVLFIGFAVLFHENEDRREFDKVFCTMERRYGDAWTREQYLTTWQKYVATNVRRFVFKLPPFTVPFLVLTSGRHG